MRSRVVHLILVLMVVTLVPLGAEFDESDLNLVTFTNLTRNEIVYIFLSPGDSEYWGPEILGATRTLEPNDSLGFYILYPNECDAFDIMAVDSEGGTIIIYDYEICDGEQELIEFVRKDLIEDPPDMNFVTVYIQNDTLPIYYIFISPSDSEMWGVDYLDENTILEMDGMVSFLFPFATDNATDYDLMGVDEEADTYRFQFSVDANSDDDLYAIEVGDLE